MEMTVSSTVTRPPRAMYQNQSFITWGLMSWPAPASPWEPNDQRYSTSVPVVVTSTVLNS